jgi:hypothetical protein
MRAIMRKDKTFPNSRTAASKKPIGCKPISVETEMETMFNMFKNWCKSDFNWAANIIKKQGGCEEGEFDFLRKDLNEKFSHWMYPKLERLYKTKYITEDEAVEFAKKIYDIIDETMMRLYELGDNKDNV